MNRKILKASAGTGKTYRLAIEYLASLINGNRYNDILVMTFTNKATEELKERVIKFLYEISIGSKEGENVIESIKALYNEISIERNQVKKIYKEILLNKDKLKIYTIDGFKGLIFKTSIGPMNNIYDYEIISDEGNTEILKKTFEKISHSSEIFSIFERFFEFKVERNVDNYISTLKDIISNRWKYILVKENKEVENKLDKTYSLKTIFDSFEEMKEIVIDIVTHKGKELNLKEYTNKAFHPYLEIQDEYQKEKFITDNWKKIIDSKYINGVKIKRTKTDEYTNEMLDRSNELKEIINEEISKKIYIEEILPYEKEVLAIIEAVYEIYNEIKFQEKRFTHEDLTNYVLMYMYDEKLNIIKDNKITEYMKEILDSSCKVIFIDEFQDTSIAQWRMLEPFVKSAETAIVVGDEKQSIYGWRGGDKELFKNLGRNIEAIEEYLETSYRSEKNINDFTNEIFSKISKIYESEKDSSIRWDFKNVNSHKKEEIGKIAFYDCVETTKSEKESGIEKENYLEKLIDILKKDFNGRYKGVGILARKNTTLNEIADILTENGIPYFLETNLNIFNHKKIKPIISLLKYFKTKEVYYLLEFLRSDAIFINNVVLNKILMLEVEEAETAEYLKKVIDLDTGYNEKIVLKKILMLYEKYQKDNFKNLEVIIDIIREFGITEKEEEEEKVKEINIKNIYRFIEISKKFENIFALLEEIEKNSDSGDYKQIGIENIEGVTLMTIHKSKGLEFDSVLYIYEATQSRPQKRLEFHLKMDDNYEKVEDYLITDKDYGEIYPYLENVYNFSKRAKEKEEEEEINNLYVGLTRPRGNLYILVKKINKKNLSNLIREEYLLEYNKEVAWEMGSLKVYEKEEIIEASKKEIYGKLIIDLKGKEINPKEVEENRIRLEKDKNIHNFEREEKRNIGNIYHYFFEYVKYGEEAELDFAKKKTIARFGSIFGKEKIQEIVSMEKMKKLIEKNKRIFSKDWDTIHAEYEIYSDEENKLYRIDRLMINNLTKEILIVDFKTGSYEEEQIENYKKLVEQELEKLGMIEEYKIETKYIQL